MGTTELYVLGLSLALIGVMGVLGAFALAIEWLMPGWATNPTFARFLLGRALLASGDATAATLEFRKALELRHPENEVVPELARVGDRLVRCIPLQDGSGLKAPAARWRRRRPSAPASGGTAARSSPRSARYPAQPGRRPGIRRCEMPARKCPGPGY